MGSCCHHESSFSPCSARQRRTLWLTLGINALMFGVIVGAAWYGRSTALLADSLDNLGDALTYGLSLYVVSRDRAAKARVALFKGGLIFAAAAGVVVQIVHRLFHPGVPLFEVMGVFSLLGLAANGACLWLLWQHRQEDINMSSVWACSRNDVAGNVAVLVAAALVWLTGAAWPDVVVASGLVLLLLVSSVRVLSAALAELRITAKASPAQTTDLPTSLPG
ncbi:cation transporter [Chloracidobacterium thermophilum]|uniref:Co/Zn/Cd efflux system component n=1 Tax=Chloracidobacterium thermophilum (strain B) TaxID=981222 RepID=G2LHE8_CHLTF|nr:cation transporter [Chloracidobacterium thermophilum]AEP12211.1 Co/Zn/Cd efflux system component [Chloracidobacterium thermophilum B]QUV77949.1 cation transporter [Chloracidobacterium thermophilum]